MPSPVPASKARERKEEYRCAEGPIASLAPMTILAACGGDARPPHPDRDLRLGELARIATTGLGFVQAWGDRFLAVAFEEDDVILRPCRMVGGDCEPTAGDGFRILDANLRASNGMLHAVNGLVVP